jgi:hypothetical protein
MKQSKFSLADLLTVLAAPTFGFVCFLGKNYSTLGDIPNSIIWSAFIALLLGGFAMCAKILKRTYNNFKICFIWERIFLVLFTILTILFAYYTFPHFFVVYEGKAEIQRKLTASIVQAENMFTEYEHYAENRKRFYENKLKGIILNKEINPSEYNEYFVSNNINDIKQMEKMMFDINADLFPSNYTDMKQKYSTWFIDAQNIVENWKWISIVDVVKEVGQNSDDWLSGLIELSTVREKNEQADNFAYKLEFDNVKKYFTAPGRPTLFSISSAILLYVLMLLPWLFSIRSSKSHKEIPTRCTDITNI